MDGGSGFGLHLVWARLVLVAVLVLLVLALLGFTGSVSVARYIRGFDDIEDEEDGA